MCGCHSDTACLDGNQIRHELTHSPLILAAFTPGIYAGHTPDLKRRLCHMADIRKIFIGGGGDDWVSHIVEDYAAAYAKLNPLYDCRYFS